MDGPWIDGFNKQLRDIRWKCPRGIAQVISKAVCKHSFSFVGSQVNWTILRNVSAATTMSDTWKTQRNSLKISLTTDEGEEVSTEGEGKGRFVCNVNFLCAVVLIYRTNTWFRHRSVVLTRTFSRQLAPKNDCVKLIVFSCVLEAKTFCSVVCNKVNCPGQVWASAKFVYILSSIL